MLWFNNKDINHRSEYIYIYIYIKEINSCHNDVKCNVSSWHMQMGLKSIILGFDIFSTVLRF